MSHFVIKENDTSPALQVTLKDGTGTVVNVTGATIVFSMSAGGVVKVNQNSNVALTTPTGGVVTYSWQTGDTDTPGTYYGEFEVTFAGGLIETYPNSKQNQLDILIEPEIA